MDRKRTPDGVVAVDLPVPLPSSLGVLPVLWWVPAGRPIVGVAWLQHGYARNPHYLNALAAAFADVGLVVAMPTVESFRRKRSINDEDFLDGIGAALADVTRTDGLVRDVVTRAGRQIGRDVDATALTRLVLVAHSAGCAVVARAARRALADGTPIRGVVLLDATDNLAKSFTSSVGGLVGVPVRGVFAQPSWCNRKGQGARALLAARDGFVGIRLTTGTHCDAEGRDTDRVCRTMCGKPDPANVDVLYEATTAWTRSLLLEAVPTDWEPGGYRLEDETRIGRIEQLEGSGSG